MDDSRSTDSEFDWVTGLLAAQPSPAAPDDVVGRVLGALAEEQSLREAAGRAKTDSLGELLRRSDNGTFGANAPAHYTKKGLGLRRSQTPS